MGKRLSGKRIILTGAASGIGRASALRFAEEGAKQLLVDVSEQGLSETAELVKQAGGEVITQVADAGNEADVKAFVARAKESFGGVDVLFANAGISGGLPTLSEISADHFNDILRVNLVGVFLAVKEVVPDMIAQGSGSIICTASVAGVNANAGSIAYSASKAGVISLIKTVASQELLGTGVRINGICPGLIETGMTQPLFDYARAAGKEDKLGQFAPMGRHGVPREIANMALFLASDEASFVHGQAFPVDGGLTSTLPYRYRPAGQSNPLPGFKK